jgi:death on curing protein
VTDPTWVTEEMVLAIHAALAAEHGSRTGIRDADLLGSAIARPRNAATYDDRTIPQLAASLAFGIARNHPFIDGNKRVALMAAYVFLGLNGLRLNASEEAATAMTLSLAAGETSEEAFAEWIAASVEAR